MTRELAQYVMQNATRGACMCGRCSDAIEQPETQQPEGHTVDLTFFKVAADGDATADDLRKLVMAEAPQYLDGNEHSYLEIGGDVGDQGVALMLIGLGHVLGVWKAMCPETMLPFMPDDVKRQLAGRGMISLQASQKTA